MMKALHSQAQLTTVVEVDVTRIMQLRARAKDGFAAREGVKLSPMPFFVKAAAEALKAHPVVNATIDTTTARSPTSTSRTSASRWTPRRA